MGISADVDLDAADLDTDDQLVELIRQMEAIDWRNVPGISSLEAAVWTRRCIEARDALESGTPVSPFCKG